MPELDLDRLRNLRSRAEMLLNYLADDLTPFQHRVSDHGFRRTPESESIPGDVNVTTTCSCLMSLALTDKLRDFYTKDAKQTLKNIFEKLLTSPWMSSGLTENNAFTTALVLRVLGFLVQAEVMTPSDAESRSKDEWEPELKFNDFASFAHRISNSEQPFCGFLFALLPKTLQDRLNLLPSSPAELDAVMRQIATELNRLVRTENFYKPERFKDIQLSPGASQRIGKVRERYEIAHFNRILLHDFFSKELAPLESKSLKQIAVAMCSSANRFKINDYPPSAAVVYWFVDGVDRAQISLEPKDWETLCHFATDEFGRQRSLAVAKHAAMMDPIAMAMSACLCSRLRAITSKLQLTAINSELPSTVELERAVADLFLEQTPSGIWPKYFPLFHYQDAGANFCFTFELLEAVFVEFGGKQNRLLENESVLYGLERSIEWCERNRLSFSKNELGKEVLYMGWNSGGNLVTLRKGQPESWATAVVHMFLWELIEVLSRCIQQHLLDKYAARNPLAKWKPLDQLLDIGLWLENQPASLVSTLKNSILKTFRPFVAEKAEQLRKKPRKKAPLSALLFGPPGTSKTEVAKAIAKELSWPLLEIDPSHFLQDGFQNIYIQANKIFEDVMDLCGVVVLFDEMDALVQKRDADTVLDTESKFLTTYMLPKLAKLHDRGQLVFLMATNFQASFDDAIKRAGRFDYLLCMGPPTLQSKCDSIHVFFDAPSSEQTQDAGKLIWQYASDSAWLSDQLSLYTYGEFETFISSIAPVDSINGKIVELGPNGFEQKVRDDGPNISLKLDDLRPLRKVVKWKRLEELDKEPFDEHRVKEKKINSKIPAIKYVLDRKQTRRQFAILPAKLEQPENGIVNKPSKILK
jgi:hypothetical protein